MVEGAGLTGHGVVTGSGCPIGPGPGGWTGLFGRSAQTSYVRLRSERVQEQFLFPPTLSPCYTIPLDHPTGSMVRKMD